MAGAVVPANLLLAVAVAVAISLVLALVEIQNRSKSSLRASIGTAFFVYWIVLSFGNSVTTLLASVAVSRMSPSLSSWYFLFCAFFGVFAFAAVLRNTNITMFDKGVLTIQDWIDKALNVAAGDAIARDQVLQLLDQQRLLGKMQNWDDAEINARILDKFGQGKVQELEAAAAASAANTKLYKIMQLSTAFSKSERAAILRNTTVG
jgi:hypothetical protein